MYLKFSKASWIYLVSLDLYDLKLNTFGFWIISRTKQATGICKLGLCDGLFLLFSDILWTKQIIRLIQKRIGSLKYVILEKANNMTNAMD